MRAVTIPRKGPPTVLEVREHPDPTPDAGQVRVAVRATGLNFADVSARQGLYPDAPKMPCVMGYEVAGVIDAVGAGVSTLREGDRVIALTRFGGHASSVVVPVEQAFPMPAGMSFAEGAALPVNYLTAHHMLFYLGTVHPRSSLLVHAAAGGVGTAVLQLVRPIEGVVTFGTASTSKHDYLRALGCTHPIDYRRDDYAAIIRERTGGRGVDIVLDPLGGEHWRKSWSLLAPAGRWVAFGFSAAIDGSSLSYVRLAMQAVQIPMVTPVSAMNDNRSLQGCNMGHLWDERTIIEPQIRRLLELFEAGVIRPHVDAEIPFDRAAEAHALLEERKNKGKVVLVP